MKRKIKELKGWDKNPRKIHDHDFERLKQQVLRLGVYKPLLTMKDGTVIGGNMRLRVFNEIKVTEVECSVLEFKKEGSAYVSYINGTKQPKATFKTPEQGMLEYAMSDNDSAGYTDEELLMKQLEGLPSIDDIPLNFYGVAMIPPSNLADIVGGITPVEDDEQGDLDGMSDKKMCECPNCGSEHEFNAITAE